MRGSTWPAKGARTWLCRCVEREYTRSGGKADDGGVAVAVGISTTNSSPSRWVASIRQERAMEYQDGAVCPWCNTTTVEEMAAWRQCERTTEADKLKRKSKEMCAGSPPISSTTREAGWDSTTRPVAASTRKWAEPRAPISVARCSGLV